VREQHPAPGADTARWLARGDLLAVGAVLVLEVVAWAVGDWLFRHGADVHAATPPLYAGWLPRVGPGSLAAVLVAVLVVLRGPRLAARLPFRRLLCVGYLVSVAWTVALALIDGWNTGIAGRLTESHEYLVEVPRVIDAPGEFLRTFTEHILAFQPGSFTTHVAAHPPLAVLLFAGMDRIGLGGGGPAGLLCILIGASAPMAVGVALRGFGGADGERLARVALPFGVLAPAAIWVGVSADGMYAAVLAWAVALLVQGGSRPVLALISGVLFGCCLFFSYGLALAGLFPLAVLALTRRVRPVLLATVGVVSVTAVFAALGFWWFDAFSLVKQLYAQPLQFGSADRPYGYWVWAAPGAFAVALGPATVAGVRRMLAGAPALFRVPAGWSSGTSQAVAARALTALACAGLLAALIADLSGMSRGESERIWLPFAIWLIPTAALLPARHARWWLLAQAVVALTVNHLLNPPW
jgi:hypothetical protein